MQIYGAIMGYLIAMRGFTRAAWQRLKARGRNSRNHVNPWRIGTLILQNDDIRPALFG
ncbi:hypothetical protein JOE11_001423 [Robbsia andropogonis]